MDREKYIVYQYLRFIWQKKWYVVAAAVLFMLLGFLYSHRNPVVYTGQAVVFTGTAENDELSKPDLIRNYYNKLVPNKSLTVTIPANFEIVLKVTDRNQQKAQQLIEKVGKQYVSDLKSDYTVQYSDQIRH
jgi:uncharacterized protein involved in exopolysaccharide biosynthesis